MDNAIRKYGKKVPFAQKFVWRFRYRGIRPQDVMLASYGKSGNTWVKHLIFHVLTGEAPNFNQAESLVPSLVDYRQAPEILPGNGRILKTHAPLGWLYPWHFGRAIYIVRDGRDVMVSNYFFMLRKGLFDGSFSEFLRAVLQGDPRVLPHGQWHSHVDSWISSAFNEPNKLLVVRYEDMLGNTLPILAEITAFLDLRVAEHELEQAIESNSAEKMRGREKTWQGRGGQRVREIPFVRAAKAGDWREYFDDGDLNSFMSIAGPTMRRLGYITTSDD